MRDKDKTVARPSDIRSISDPPGLGRARLRPAEEVAKEILDGDMGWTIEVGRFEKAEALLADIIRRSRAEGAAAELEDAAVALEHEADSCVSAAEDRRGSGYDDIDGEEVEADTYKFAAALLRARAKTISDPPDPG